MKFIDDAKLKAAVWWRERKDKAEERKAERERNIPYGASPLLWCVFITLVGVFALGGSTWMLAVFIAGSVGHLDWVSDYVTTQAGVQHWEYTFEASVHWFNAIGLWLLCAAIGIFNAVWIEIRKHFFGVFQKWITGLGIATALFMVSGGVVVQQRGTDARTRDEVAAVGTAQTGVAAIDAEIEALTQRWQTLCAENLTTYQAQACRSGETAWRERIETARSQRDYQLPGIERALADAREGDRMQARLLELRRSRAQANVQTVRAETTTVRAEGWIAPVVAFIEDLRKPVTSVLGELLAMSAFPMALAARATRRRRRDIEASGWADESHRIEDLRDQAPVESGKVQMQTVMEEEDLNTGEKRRMVTPKPYWRTVKKGKKQTVEVPPEVEADEVGVTADGGNRIARTVAGPIDLDNPGVAPSAFERDVGETPQVHDEDEAEGADEDRGGDGGIQPKADETAAQEQDYGSDNGGSLQSSDLVQETPPEELGDDDAAFLDEAPVEPASADERQEPETDERRMIAAE